MLYKTDVANLALARLGVSLNVADIDTDNSTQAKIIRRHYKNTLETLLEYHPWNFATKQLALALLAEDPVPGYLFAYSLPADCLVLRQIACEGIFPQVTQYENEKVKWVEVYSGAAPIIHTNVKNAHGKYTVKILESAAMPNHFAKALAAQLSMDIGPQLITNNFSKVEQALNARAISDRNNGIAFDMGRQPIEQDSFNPFYRARLE